MSWRSETLETLEQVYGDKGAAGAVTAYLELFRSTNYILAGAGDGDTEIAKDVRSCVARNLLEMLVGLPLNPFMRVNGTPMYNAAANAANSWYDGLQYRNQLAEQDAKLTDTGKMELRVKVEACRMAVYEVATTALLVLKGGAGLSQTASLRDALIRIDEKHAPKPEEK